MSRAQISFEAEIQRRAKRRADDLGISLAEYVRSLVVRDLGHAAAKSDPSIIFNLGTSHGSHIAKNKDQMIGEAVAAANGKRHRGR